MRSKSIVFGLIVAALAIAVFTAVELTLVPNRERLTGPGGANELSSDGVLAPGETIRKSIPPEKPEDLQNPDKSPRIDRADTQVPGEEAGEEEFDIAVKGRVTDSESGLPVSGARISVIVWGDAESDEGTPVPVDKTVTDAQGYYTFPIHARAHSRCSVYALHPLYDGFENNSCAFLGRKGGMECLEIDIKLCALGTISGKVVELASSAPISGARVFVLGFKPRSFETVSDRSGRFSIPGIPMGGYCTVCAEYAGFAVAAKSFFFVKEEDVLLALEAGEDLHGVVRDPASGAVRGARVHCFPSAYRCLLCASSPVQCGYGEERAKCFETETDDRGEFSFVNLPSNVEHLVLVKHPEFADEVVRSVPGRFLEIRLSKGSIVTLRAIDESGRDISDSLQRFSFEMKHSSGAILEESYDVAKEGTGGFHASSDLLKTPGLPEGTYSIWFRTPGYVEYRSDGLVLDGTSPATAHITLSKEAPKPSGSTGKVLLRVVPPSGSEKPAKCAVYFYVGSRWAGSEQNVSPEGLIQFPVTFVPQTIQAVILCAPDFAPCIAWNVDIRPGENTVEFSLDKGRRVSGIVKNADTGKPLESVFLWPIMPFTHKMEWAPRLQDMHWETGADGTFDATGIPSGRIALEFSLNGYVTHREIMDISQPGLSYRLDVRMDRGGQLVGTVVNEKGEAIGGGQVVVYQGDAWELEEDVDESGRFTIHLNPGRYRIIREGFITAEAEVRKGETTNVEMMKR